MKSNHPLAGTGKVFSFTLLQQLKGRANIISAIILIVISLIAYPLSVLFSNGSDNDQLTDINRVYIHNESELSLDLKLFKSSNSEFKNLDILSSELTADNYASAIKADDVYLEIISSCSSSYELKAHILSGSTVSQASLETLTDAISSQLSTAAAERLGVSADTLNALFADSGVTSYSEDEYLKKDSNLGFDGSFAVQYGYSIAVMILCTLASSLIIRSVVEEKASKLVDLLMVSVQPLSLVLGKILAVMTYVVMLIVSMLVCFFISYQVTGIFLSSVRPLSAVLSSFGVDPSMLRLDAATAFLCFIALLIAFSTVSVFSGLVGTCCSTVEEIESATGIVVIVIMVGYGASCMSAAFSNPAAVLIFAFCPVVSVFCAPVLYVCRSISLPVFIGSLAIQLAILAALSLFTAKIYRNLLLYKGSRLKLGQLSRMLQRKEGGDLANEKIS